MEVLFMQSGSIVHSETINITNPLVKKDSVVFILILFSFLGILKNYYLYKLEKDTTFLFGFVF